ncbi:MAG TPA: phenylalanine--tRNA ligase subunit alpha [archaeon]|nr:phenylalanine--tRNA ligase subunit alpha [archaeon]
MDLKAIAAALSDIEKKTLRALTKEPASLEEVSSRAGIGIDSVRRASSWLSEKGLAKTDENKTKKLVLTSAGKDALDRGLPEKRLLQKLSEKGALDFLSAKEQTGLGEQEFNAALGVNKRKAFIAILRSQPPKIEITEVGKEFLPQKTPEEKALLEISKSGKADASLAKELITRGLAEEKEESAWKMSATKEGENVLELKEFSAQRAYNIEDPVPKIHIGKKQPYIQFLNTIRRKLTELGFKEMEAPLIVPEFYNFDVLFQPQNHPARTWTDTYQLKAPNSGKLADRRAVQAIKAAHENGGVSGSSGWGYRWSEEIASRIMPAAHGTAHTARQLTKITQKDIPCKYFTIARCFRPDVLDATHLIEFNQTDGFILGDNLNFRHQLGVLEQFAKEIAGAQEVKFLPDYYPFTEPSVQLSAKHPTLGWVELGGAGMLRPEILKNLGINCMGFAWGIGIDRLAMFKLGIKDIRYLFSDNLEWLRKTPQVIE